MVILSLCTWRSAHPCCGAWWYMKVTSGPCLGAAVPGSESESAIAQLPEEMVQVVAGCSFPSLMGNVTLFHIRACASYCSGRCLEPCSTSAGKGIRHQRRLGLGPSEGLTLSPSDGAVACGGYLGRERRMLEFTFREFKDTLKHF